MLRKKRKFTLQDEKRIYEEKWNVFYNECLETGKVDRLKAFSLMQSLNNIDFLILKENYTSINRRRILQNEEE